MQKQCENCNETFEAQGEWQKLCLNCYKASKSGIPPVVQQTTGNNKDRLILRQVFMKIASEQVKGPANLLLDYAKQLEVEWDKW